MQEYLSILKKSHIFRGLKEENILDSLTCLGAKVRQYKKGEIIFSEGDTPKFMGVILNGCVEIQKIDFNGNSNIITKLSEGEVIAAAACYSSENMLPFDVVSGGGKIMCLDVPSIIRPCQKNCDLHIKIIENLLNTIADSNIRLTNKINVLTKRTIKEKLLAFLYAESKKQQQKKFCIKLTRQQIADNLSVDRSALSRELSNMKSEGIIDFDKDIFWFN